ncbi:hypothetical protein ACS5NO_20725 [Larkinella sp. GY13]|uniref:hypothetical protein n=1 Tax=Larkinella sp. GY13 TaxID=3453720 RepID=UPI003EEE6700
MKKIRLSLRHFFQTQAEEENPATPVVETPPVEASAENEPLSSEAPPTEETAPVETAPTQASEDVMQVEMSETEYQTLLADAGHWRKNKAELETLRRWHGNLVGQAVTPGADANTGTTGKKRSYETAPWNQ